MRVSLRTIMMAVLLQACALLLAGATLGCSSAPGSHIRATLRSNTTSKPYWLPDGSAILFSSRGQGAFFVDVSGTRMRKISESTWRKDSLTGSLDRFGLMSAALSPDGSRVAYVAYTGRPPGYSEIRIADLYGLDVISFDHGDERYFVYPAWSPDGSQIVYLSFYSLTIADADRSNERRFEQAKSSYLPTWSSDGSWIAFVGRQQTQGKMSEYVSYHNVLTLIRPDGSDLTTVAAVAGVSQENQKERATGNSNLIVLGALASVPAWSPDGSRIAFFQVEQGSVVLYTLELAVALGHEQGEARKLLSLESDALRPRSRTTSRLLYTTLSWSPDGTALLFTSEQIPGHVVSVEDGRVLTDVGPGWAAWSPDGARIAVVNGSYDYVAANGVAYRDVLYTIGRDGTDKRVLVRGNAVGSRGQERFSVAGDQ